MTLVVWIWLLAGCVLAVSVGGFGLLFLDRLARNKRGKVTSASREAILGLLADDQLSDPELHRQVDVASRQGVLPAVVLEAVGLVLGASRLSFIERLKSVGAAGKLRSAAMHGQRNLRLQAISALRLFSEPGDLACLQRMWRDRDTWVRLASLTASLGTPVSPTFDTILENTVATGPQFRGRAQRLVRSAAALNLQAARQAIGRSDLPSWIRVELVEALRKSPDPSTLAPLLVAAADDDADLRAAAIGVLGEIGLPEGLGAIIDAIDDRSWQVRVRAVSAVAALRLKEARPKLVIRINDPNWWVRFRASEALSQLDQFHFAGARR